MRKTNAVFQKNKCPFYATNRVEWAFFDGGPEEIRTLDLSDANRTLSQLSYRPNSNCQMIITRSFFNCNTFFIFLCKSFFVRKNEKRGRKLRQNLRLKTDCRRRCMLSGIAVSSITETVRVNPHLIPRL